MSRLLFCPVYFSPGTHWTEVEAIAMPSTMTTPALDAPKVKSPRKPKPRAPQGPLTTASFSLRFAPPPPPPDAPKPKPQRVAKPKVKIDPQLVAEARELRDRCMERQDAWLTLAPGGKYDVARALPQRPAAAPLPLLKAG